MRRTVVALAVLAAASSVAACQVPTSTAAGRHTASAVAAGSTAGTLPVDDPNYPVAAPGTCHLRSEGGQPLPDPSCTPGAINPAVTQANIGSTICRSGWTATIRPPVAVTNRIKRETDLAYGLPTNTVGELDHEVSLEIGGAPADPRNLWVEVGSIPNPKDTVENALHRAVCSGRVTLAAAQQAITSDWTTAEQSLGL